MNRTRMNRLTSSACIVEGGVTRGIIEKPGGREVLFVDSGLEARTGRQLLRAVEENEWQPAGLLTTHGHADHFGGHAAIVAEHPLPVFASRGARPFLEHPRWHATMLHSGATPPLALTDKFFVAEPVTVDGIVGETEPLPAELADWGLAVYDLPGHTRGMVGFAAGGVLFCGDAFLEPRLLLKHGLPALVDVEQALTSLTRIRRDLLPLVQYVVISHGGVYSPATAREVVDKNATYIERQLQLVLDQLTRPMLVDELVAAAARAAGHQLKRLGDVALWRMTVSAFLTYLEAQDEVATTISDGLCMWHRI